jgi:hypothetical protein
MVDRINGYTPSGTFISPYTFLISIDAEDYIHASNAFQTIYGGPDDAGEVDGTDPIAVIQAALDGLTAGRTWQEKIVCVGDFELDGTITISGHTAFQVIGKITIAAGYNKCPIQVYNGSQIDIDISNIDGNGDNQEDTEFPEYDPGEVQIPECPFCIQIMRCSFVNLKGYFHDAYRENVHIYQSDHVKLDVAVENSKHYEGLALTGEPDHDTYAVNGTIFSKNNYSYGFHSHRNTYNLDLTIVDEGSGDSVDIWQTNNSRFRVFSKDSAGVGISMTESMHNTIDFVIIDAAENGFEGGGYAEGVPYLLNNIIRGSVSGSGGYGVSLWSAVGNTLTIEAYDNDDIGIKLFESTNNKMDHCIAYDTGANPAAPQNWGYSEGVDGNSDDNQIVNCDFRNNVLGAIIKTVGTNTTVKDTFGFINEVEGAATILSGESSVTFAHGLDSTPNIVTLGPNHAEVSGAFWYADDTDLTISISPSTTTGDRVVSYRAGYKY